MTKINYQEIKDFSNDLIQLKEIASYYLQKSILANQQFLDHSQLSGKLFERLKNIHEHCQLIAKAVFDALTTLDTHFKSYLTVLIETVTKSSNKLKLDELHHLQKELTLLQQEKITFMENMAKTFNEIPTLKKLFSTESQQQKKKEIDLIQRHHKFEITTQKHFSDIQRTISAINQGLFFLKKQDQADALDAPPIPLNLTTLPWYNQLVDFNQTHKS